jgi:hypothetical protein
MSVMIGMHHESDCMFLYTFSPVLGSMALTSTILKPMVTWHNFRLNLAPSIQLLFNGAIRGPFGKAKHINHMLYKQHLDVERYAIHKLFIMYIFDHLHWNDIKHLVLYLPVDLFNGTGRPHKSSEKLIMD